MKNFLPNQRLLPTLAALFLAFAAMAQGKVTFTAKGTVKDETGSPMVGVPVQLRGTTVGTLSDIDGTYTLTGTVNAGTYEMIASIIGYASSVKKVNISASGTNFKQDFDLSPRLRLSLKHLVKGQNLA